MNACTTPVPAEDLVGDGRWMSMHNRYVTETINSEPDIVFIGDSIIQGLLSSSLWAEKISSLHCVNFGIGGDRVEHVLWRLLNGEMDFNVKIKAVVLLVGTNNLPNKPEEILEGIVECIKVIKNKLGDVHVVLPTILPRGQNPNPLREKNTTLNTLLLTNFENNPNCQFNHIHMVPIHENVLQSDNTISHYIMYDYLHLSDAGYSKIFTPVYEKLCCLVQNKK